jgi:GNAT superfamily N-acetyltransferase
VDPETGQEYRWDDVVVFDENVEEGDRERILAAIKTTPMLREGVFLFSGGISIRLSDIPPGGVWIRTLGSSHGKTVYRVTVRTRFQGSYDLAVNVNHELDPGQVREEIRWLILCSASADRPSLVEEFGGYWREDNLWTEEFITGETLHRALRRISRREGEGERLRQIWPFFAWKTLNAFVEFWDRTGRMWEIADSGMHNVIVPTHDYHTGSRLVSISLRREHRGIPGMLRWFRREFIARVEREYPELEGAVGNGILFSSILEVLGETEGIAALRDAMDDEEFADDLRTFLGDVEARGFLPSRLYFAVERYRRWARLNVDPTLRARARTMREIFETYGLRAVAQLRPDTRARFFRETVFRNAAPPLAEGLDRIVVRLQKGELDNDGMADAIADLRAGVALDPDEDFFLARLSFPHLRPEDTAGFVDTEFGDRSRGEMVVTVEDRDGNNLRIRHALNPREVARLHRLFLDANLEVHFRQEHRYLVALNDRNRVIGGIYYDVEEDGTGAHLEKIVVAQRYRRCGIAEGLMNEFFNRLRDAGVTTVTTGFFRPEYFYTFDFKIEKKYAGLVKKLQDRPSGSP